MPGVLLQFAVAVESERLSEANDRRRAHPRPFAEFRRGREGREGWILGHEPRHLLVFWAELVKPREIKSGTVALVFYDCSDRHIIHRETDEFLSSSAQTNLRPAILQ